MTAVFGIEFCPHSQAELVALMTRDAPPPGEAPRTVVTANLDHIGRLPRDAEFREAYHRAWAVTADGMPVYLYARLRGAAAPARVAGSDLLSSLLPALTPGRDRVFLVASDGPTGERIHDYLVGRGFAPDEVAWVVPSYGFEHDARYSAWLAGHIRSFAASHLIFGVGSPKSEVWIDHHRHEIGGCYALAVGAGLEFFADTKRRAPVWMRRCGLEWSWRLAQEPRRLWRRYLVMSWRFLGAVRNDLFAGQS
jgi:N-acetylglucosaminyldiphosphoundecaprenol N-acetyl-beta-D-mannosaminyltransferase